MNISTVREAFTTLQDRCKSITEENDVLYFSFHFRTKKESREFLDLIQEDLIIKSRLITAEALIDYDHTQFFDVIRGLIVYDPKTCRMKPPM